MNLLRRHVSDCPKDLAGKTQIRRCDAFRMDRTSGRHELRKTKIQDLHITIKTNHDVLGLQVPMYNARTMRCAKRLKHLSCDLNAALNRRPAVEQIPQGFAFYQLRH